MYMFERFYVPAFIVTWVNISLHVGLHVSYVTIFKIQEIPRGGKASLA